MDIYLATTNENKVKELQRLFDAASMAGIRVLSAGVLGGMPEVEETEDTFEGNARLKVRALMRKVPQGACVLGEDSGFAVDALKGAPGVYSARYCGEEATDGDNIKKVLSQLEGIEADERGAQFVCCMVFHHPEAGEVVFQGSVRGQVVDAPRGENGFGYDPIFIPRGKELTFAQMTGDEKNSHSHRGLAFQELVDWLWRFVSG